MSDEAPILLRPPMSILAGVHRRHPWPNVLPWPRGEMLYGGPHGVYRPTMAAKTLQRLGDVRHALAQRCIAGTLEVHAPFAPALSEDAQKHVDRKLNPS